MSTSCSDVNDLNPFSVEEEQDKAFKQFLLLVALTNAAANTPPPWWNPPTSVQAEEIKAEWDKLEPAKKAEACAIAFANGEKPPEELCAK
ncbi:hypothetical protein CH352_16230 [Leptospira hartskeerlii]|uniref:Uncharacterized protein n=1 Tax=Leptospira hartskeerlii TaxID=2023177 RepID=A0A2M9X9P4_9LEPT|nr:hypothetical protein CH357_16725 [Leptospira hartskeerlii]PJZ32543.1 hypothetical protein CH352_16230 [Leptospira hartskeerlii]